ncbi:hypothetical protein AB5I83_08205 [Mesobacillus sp. LC4]
MMNKKILFSFLGVLVVLLSVAGYKQVIEAKEKELDMQYLNHIPTVLYDDLQLELYEYGQCKEDTREDREKEPSVVEPSSCETVTMEEALAGKQADTFDSGKTLTVKSRKPSGELEDNKGPADGVRRTSSGGFTKDGASLGPDDVKITDLVSEDQIVSTVVLPDAPGYYTGNMDISTPSGTKQFVYHFNLK